MSKANGKPGRKAIPAVAYLRRSDKGQEASITDQRAVIVEYANRHGYQIIREYVDDGISGDDTEKRRGFLSMHHDGCNGRDFDVILCWDQDRFGRFDSTEAGFWIYPLRKAGVRLVTVTDGSIDWDSFTGRMMYAMKQEGKNQFLIDLSTNVLRGQMEGAKAGSWIGSVPYGYKIEGEKKKKRLLLGNPAHRRIVKRIFKEFVEQGRSMSNIASRLNEDGVPSAGGKGKPWRFDAVKWILQNPVYVGMFRCNVYSRGQYHGWRNGEVVKGGSRLVLPDGAKNGRNAKSDWIVIPDHHEPIIDQHTFDQAQAILAKGKTGRTRYTPEDNPYLLSGLLRCGRCGSTLWGMDSRVHKRFECSRAKYNNDCQGTYVREDEVLDFLAEHIENEFISHDVQRQLDAKARRGELTAKDLPKAFTKLKQLLVGPDSPKTNRARIAKDIEGLDAAIAKARRNLIRIEDERNVPVAEAEIAAMQEERDALAVELNNRPTEQDINKTVLEVLHKLFWLATLATGKNPDRIKPILRELDHITVHTVLTGQGNGTRHAFERGEVHFKRVGGITSNLDPHLPGKSRECCR